jgi:hypothetical protein
VKVYIFRGRQTLKNYLKAIELVAWEHWSH